MGRLMTLCKLQENLEMIHLYVQLMTADSTLLSINIDQSTCLFMKYIQRTDLFPEWMNHIKRFN